MLNIDSYRGLQGRMVDDKLVTFSLSMAENMESSHSKVLKEMEKFDITHKAFVAFIS